MNAAAGADPDVAADGQMQKVADCSLTEPAIMNMTEKHPVFQDKVYGNKRLTIYMRALTLK